MSTHGRCGLFDKLPVELRLKIWTELFSFSAPLRFSPQTTDPVDMNILCTNRHLYKEALGILFTENTICVMRTDFCSRRDITCPVPSQHVRHLIVADFDTSLQCYSYKAQCPSCQYPGLAFLDVLQQKLPCLKTVIVDYSARVKLFWGFREALKSSTAPKLTCTSLGVYKLSNLPLPHLDVTFQNLPIVRTYPSLLELAARKPTRSQTKAALEELRRVSGEVDLLWYLLCEARAVGEERSPFSVRVQEFWVHEPDLQGLDDEQRSDVLSNFTEAVQECLELEGPALCRE
nr:hypothetical protein CFP56_01378 [Quercus suber]